MRLAQRAADIAHQRFKLVLLDGIKLDFEQKIGAALQVEAERDGLAGQPAGNVRADIVRQRVRNGDREVPSAE